MNYMTPQEAAERWGIGLRRVQYYCSNDRIPGVIRVGHQWMIPLDAQRPSDGRTKASQLHDSNYYHFPFYPFTTFFSTPSSLCEEERLLLEAQTLYLSGKLTDSVKQARAVLEYSRSDSVQFGAHYVNALNFHMLGLFSELKSSMNAMEVLYTKATAHKEDYRLLLADLRFTQLFDSNILREIDVSALSADALIYYQCSSAFLTMTSDEAVTSSLIRMYTALLRSFELMDIPPACLVLHGCLSNLYSRSGNPACLREHIQEVCRIGHDYGYHTLLSKCSTSNPDEYHLCMSHYGASFAREIEKARTEKVNNFKFIYGIMNGKTPCMGANSYENEFMLLLSYGMSVREIAALKNISQNKVRRLIENLCFRCNVSSKKDLTDHCKKLFGQL